MSGELATIDVPPGGITPAIAAATLYRVALSGRNARTARAYRSDFEDFGRFVNAPAAEALAGLVTLGRTVAHITVHGYRAELVGRGLAAATIRRRLAALKSAVKLAGQLGLCDWTLDVDPPKASAYRDTRGPGDDGWRAVRSSAEAAATSPAGRRDVALLRLLHDLALRRAEAIGLDLVDVDLGRSTLMILGKGRTAKEPITVPAPTRAAVADWIQCRGDWPGPLFVRIGRGGRPGRSRLSGEGVRLIVRKAGRAGQLSGVLRPHGLRHAGITTALDRTGGDLRAVQRFSRHKDPKTLGIYDDNRRDLGGAVAAQVAAD